MSSRVAPFGSWTSPITADRILQGAVGLGGVQRCGEDLLWTEGRPSEGGRNALVRLRPGGSPQDLLAAPFSVRSRVHEYGGGALTVAGGRIFFSNDADRRVYEASLDNEPPRPVTPEGAWRFADAVVDRRHDRLIAVGEEHGEPGSEPRNALVAIPLAGGPARVIVEGADFYASPRLSPNGDQICWLAWNHPHMPWQETELWVADLGSGEQPQDAQPIAGGSGESIFQPDWSPGGTLHFVSDRTGWGNLYRWENAEVHALAPCDEELARPHWAFGQRSYGFQNDRLILATPGKAGRRRLVRIDVDEGTTSEIPLPFVEFAGLCVGETHAWFVGAHTDAPADLVELDLESNATRVLRSSLDLDIAPEWISRAQPVEFSSRGRTAYAFYYPPTNPDFQAPDGELPPLRVRSHGGPTGASDPSFKLPIQYWTSRGFAVLDVNYAGSTGYGRTYQELLAGQWGIFDVEDCVNGAREIARRGLADEDRLTISGGSAGGYTVLCALTFHDVFRAGASHYGIGDLAALAEDTHKFESRYTDWLVAPYPDHKEVYRDRSPLFHTGQLSCPTIFFQGGQDRVVPPNQAESMVTALREKGVPVALVVFPDEGHGFRKAENIKRALEAELAFFGRVLGFSPADPIEPPTIENLEPAAKT